jgi:NAD(P)-dependent dehydrogenase (short-subunit alcohol dehydrogenase family)
VRVMITGSNRGIGLEYVRQLLARGDRVFATCRNPESAQGLQTLKEQYEARLSIIKLEVVDPESVETAYAEIEKQVDALDLIINNAAINPGSEKLADIKKSNMMQTFEVNVAGVMLVSQRFVTLLKEGNNPRFVNISSGVGSIARGGAPHLYSYSISKAALNMFNQILATEVKPMGITSIVLNPGWVITDMGGAGANLQPADSIRQQLQVIDSLTMDDTGRFKDYDGTELAW